MKFCDCLICQTGCIFTGLFQAFDRHIGCLPVLFVAVQRFPKDFLRAGHIEYIILDLEGKSDLSGNVLQLGLDLRGGMSVVLEADTASYAASHDGEVPSGSELASMLQDDIDILTSRIDQFGVSEPDIRLQGSDQILVEVPGETDPERVDAFLRGRGSLTFQLVDSSLSDRVNREYMGSLSRAFDEDGSIITPSYIPSGYTVAGYYAEDEYGIEELQSFVVLRDEVVLDGSHLVSARMERDQNGRPAVNFRLDSEGADIFYAFTSANIGERHPPHIIASDRSHSRL